MNKTVSVFDVDFSVDYDARPYVPAKISGPPEDCYEAYGGEVDITGIWIGGFEVTEVVSDAVRARIQAILEEGLADDFQAMKDQADEDRAEARAFDREWA